MGTNATTQPRPPTAPAVKTTLGAWKDLAPGAKSIWEKFGQMQGGRNGKRGPANG